MNSEVLRGGRKYCEALVERLKQSVQAGDLETAAILEFGIQECDGLIELVTEVSGRH